MLGPLLLALGAEREGVRGEVTLRRWVCGNVMRVWGWKPGY